MIAFGSWQTYELLTLANLTIRRLVGKLAIQSEQDCWFFQLICGGRTMIFLVYNYNLALFKYITQRVCM